MPEQEAPRQQLTMGSVPNAIDSSPRTIKPRCFVPATWEPLNAEGKVEYGKFVAWMIERVQRNECTSLEIKKFVHLIATEHNWDFMNVAMPHLPKLDVRHPQDKENFGMAFLHLLKPRNEQRRFDKANNVMPERDRYVNGLSTEEVEYLRRMLFGPYRGPEDCERMDRLFKSTLALGFPQPALDQLVREAKERGTDIERSIDGLPTNLHMPEGPQEPLVGPPGIQGESAERAEFKVYDSRPDEDFFKYFHDAGQAPESPSAQTADRPKSPLMPGHGPVAAGSKSKKLDPESIIVSRSDPIDIPYSKPK